MKTGICDDEKAARETLKDKVKKLYPRADILLYASGEGLFAGELPDIQMQGKSGIEAAAVYLKKGQALMAKQNYGEFVKNYLRDDRIRNHDTVSNQFRKELDGACVRLLQCIVIPVLWHIDHYHHGNNYIVSEYTQH